MYEKIILCQILHILSPEVPVYLNLFYGNIKQKNCQKIQVGREKKKVVAENIGFGCRRETRSCDLYVQLSSGNPP